MFLKLPFGALVISVWWVVKTVAFGVRKALGFYGFAIFGISPSVLLYFYPSFSTPTGPSTL